jgi:hypothetical protein
MNHLGLRIQPTMGDVRGENHRQRIPKGRQSFVAQRAKGRQNMKRNAQMDSDANTWHSLAFAAIQRLNVSHKRRRRKQRKKGPNILLMGQIRSLQILSQNSFQSLRIQNYTIGIIGQNVPMGIRLINCTIR